MALFRTCPLEVLELIAGGAVLISPEQEWLPVLHHHDILNQKDLNSLSQTCHFLHSAVNPLLWQRNRDQDRSSAVAWAIRQGQIDSLEWAKSFGLDIMQVGPGLEWPRRSRLDIMQWDPDYTTSSVAVAIQAGQDSVLTWLLDQGASVIVPDNAACAWSFHISAGPQHALHVAFDADNPSAAILLLLRGASLEYSISGNEQDKLHAMTEAIVHGMVSVVGHLVLYCGVSVDDKALRPLHSAAQLGQDAIVNCLLDHGANIDLDLHHTWSAPTALGVAMGHMWQRNSTTAVLLISRGASLEYKNVHDTEQFPGCWEPTIHALVDAIMREFMDVVVCLLTARNIDLNNPDIGNVGAFQYSVAHCSPECLQLLLDYGLSPHGPGATWEESYLHTILCARDGSSQLTYRELDCLKILLAAGAIINTRSDQEDLGHWTPAPLHSFFSTRIARDEGCLCDSCWGKPRDKSLQVLILEELIGAGADVNLSLGNYKHATPLEGVIANGSLDGVLLLVKSGAHFERKHLESICSRLELEKDDALASEDPEFESPWVENGSLPATPEAWDSGDWSNGTKDLTALFTYLAQSAEDITLAGTSKAVLKWAAVDDFLVEVWEDEEWQRRMSVPREYWVAIIRCATDPSITVDHLELAINHGHCDIAHSGCLTLIKQTRAWPRIKGLPGQGGRQWLEAGEGGWPGAQG